MGDQYGLPGYTASEMGHQTMNQLQWGGNEDLAFAGMNHPANYDAMSNQMLVNPMAQELNQLAEQNYELQQKFGNYQ